MKMRLIPFLFLLIIVPVLAEESPSQGFNYSTGIEIISSTGPQDSSESRSTKFTEKRGSLFITVQDLFYSSQPFEIPYLNDALGDKGTLTISTKQKKSWLGTATREEFFRKISVKVDMKRLKKGQVLYVYNNDTGEVLGHYSIQMKY